MLNSILCRTMYVSIALNSELLIDKISTSGADASTLDSASVSVILPLFCPMYHNLYNVVGQEKRSCGNTASCSLWGINPSAVLILVALIPIVSRLGS